MDALNEALLVWRDAVTEWAWVRSTENEKKLKAAKTKWKEEWRRGLTPAQPDAASPDTADGDDVPAAQVSSDC